MAKYTTPAWSNGASPAINAANLLAIGRALEEAQWPYGVCSTGASTTAKTVTIGFSGTFSLYTGATVRVKFSNGNTASAPTLNVNGTGAVAIANYGSTAIGKLTAGQIVTLTYDGSRWVVSGIGYANGAAIVETGSYTGTGTYGSDNKNSLTFSFAPKLVVINGNYKTAHVQASRLCVFSATSADTSEASGYHGWSVGESGYNVSTAEGLSGTLSGTTLQWYDSESTIAQMNYSGANYFYVAIG